MWKRSTEKMKSSLEKVTTVTTRHKEPTPLDLFTLLHLTDNNVRNRMLKENNTIPSLHLYSKQSQMTTTYLVNPKDNQNPTYILEAMFQIMNGKEDEFDYYIIVNEGWRNKNEIPEKCKQVDIAKLPMDKRQETLIINGKSKDGKESLTILYDIIRINPEDDNSKIIRFEKFFEGNDGCKTRAELTVKRKWFSSKEKMFQSMESQTSDNHEVHCCVQGSGVVGSGIHKTILIMHRNYEMLHDSVEQLIGEEIFAFRKERNCFDTSVLESLQFTPLIIKGRKNMFALMLSISLAQNYKGEFYYRTNHTKVGGVDKLLIFEHRDDDDYRKATPIKVIE